MNLAEMIFIVLVFIFNILLHKCLNKWLCSHYHDHVKKDSHYKNEFRAAYEALHIEGDCDKCYEILSRNI